MIPIKLQLFFFAILLIACTTFADKHTWVAATAGAANVAANWSPAVVPASGDSILFNSGAINCTDWNITTTLASWEQTSGYSGTIDFAAFLGGITVTGDCKIGGGTVSQAFGGTAQMFMSIGGKLIVTGGTFYPGDCYFVVTDSVKMTGGTIFLGDGAFKDTIKGSWIATGGAVSSVGSISVVFHNSGAVTKYIKHTGVSGNFPLVLFSATNHASATWTLQSDITADFAVTITKGILDLSTYKLTCATTLSINGASGQLSAASGKLKVGTNFSQTNGTFTAPNSFADTVGGNWTVSGGTFTPGAAGWVVLTAASGTKSINNGQSFNNVLFNGGAATVFTYSAVGLTVSKTLWVAGGTLDLLSNETNPLSVGDSVKITGGTLIASSTGDVGIGGSWINTGGTFTHNSSSGSFGFNGSGANNVIDIGGSHFYQLSIGGTGTWKAQTNDIITDASVTIAGGTLDLTTNAKKLTAGTTLAVSSGTLSAASGTVKVGTDFTLSGTGVFTAPNSAQDTIGGNWTSTAGTFTPGASGTVVFNGASGAKTINSNRTFNNILFNGGSATKFRPTTNNLTASGTVTITSGTLDLTTNLLGLTAGALTINGANAKDSSASGTHDINGDVNLSLGTLIAPSATTATAFTLSGNWNRTGGTYTHSSGRITLDGTNQTINYDNTFFRLGKSVASAATLTFQTGKTQTFTDSMVLNGAAGQLLSLRSSSSPSTWTVNPTNWSASYLDVMDGISLSGAAIAPTTSTNSGNTTNWFVNTTPQKLYWNPAAGSANYNTASNWTTDVAGTTPTTYRAKGDTLYFSGSGTRADTTCNMSANDTCTLLDFTGYTGTFNFGSYILADSGSATFVSGMTVTPGTGTLAFVGTSAGKTFNLAGKTIANLSINGTGGAWTATTNGFKVSGTLTLTAGTLNLGTALTDSAGAISIAGGVLDFGSSTLQTAGTTVNFNSLTTLTAGTGTLTFVNGSSQQTFTPKSAATHPNNTQNGAGGTIIATNDLSAATVTITSGTFTVPTGRALSASGGIAINGGTLAGAGTISSATTFSSGGTLSPGISATSATLTSSANITMASGTVFSANINGNADNDMLSWSGTGTFALGSATLSLTLGYSPVAGHTYRIVDKTSTGAYSGIFNGLSEGSIISSSYNAEVFYFSISYAGGTGNDIVLTTIVDAITALPLTLRSSATADTVYTSNWSLIFNTANGGGISFLSNATAGGGSSEIPTGKNLFYVIYNSDTSWRSAASTSLSVLENNPALTRIRQNVTLSAQPFTIDYAIQGTAKMFVRVATDGLISANKTLKFMVTRNAVGTIGIKPKTSTAASCDYILLSDNNSGSNDIIFAPFEAFSGTGAWVFDSSYANPARAGWANTTYGLAAGTRQVWEFMIDFSRKLCNDTNATSHALATDYRTPDSLEFIVGTPLCNRAWEMGGAWNFDEKSSGSANNDTARDNSTNNGRDAKMVNSTWTTGHCGSGMSFNGTNDSALVAHNTLLDATGDFTILMWVKPTGALANGTLLFKKCNEGDATITGYRLDGAAGGVVRFTIGNGTAAKTVTGTVPLGTGAWRHIAIRGQTWSDSVFIFVDGKVDAYTTTAFTCGTNANMVVMGKGYNGVLDEVRFASKRFTDEEIRLDALKNFDPGRGEMNIRADNNNTAHFYANTGVIPRYFPMYRVSNYWGSGAPLYLFLNGSALAASSYNLGVNTPGNYFTCNLDTSITTKIRLYFDNDDVTGNAFINPPPPTVYNTGTDSVVVKNFSGNTLGTVDSNHFAVVIDKRTGTTGGCGGITYYTSSTTTPGVAWNTVTSGLISSFVDTLRPTGVGTTTQLTIGGTTPAATNWGSVSDVTADNATSYVATTTASDNKTDNYLTQDVVRKGTVVDSVRVWIKIASVTGGTNISAYHIININGTNYSGSVVTMSSLTYTSYSNTWITNPATSAAWTWDSIDAMKIGVRLNRTAGANARCTQVFAEVFSHYGGSLAGQMLNPLRFRFTGSAAWDSTNGIGVSSTGNRTVTMAESSAVRMRLLVDTVKVGGGGTTIAGNNSLTNGGSDNFDNGWFVATRITLTKPAVIKSLSVYVKVYSSSFNIRLAIYDNDPTVLRPKNKKAECNSFAVSSTGWKLANVVTPVYLQAGTYWVAAWANDASLTAFYNITDNNGVFYVYGGVADAALPNPCGTGGAILTVNMSIYATFEYADSLVFGRQYTIYPDGKIFSYLQVYKATAIDTMQPGLALGTIAGSTLTPYWDNADPDYRVGGFYRSAGSAVRGVAQGWLSYQSKALKGVGTSAIVQDTGYVALTGEKKLYLEDHTPSRYDAADTTYRMVHFYDISRDFTTTAQIDTSVRSLLTASSALRFITGTPDTSDFANGDLDSNAFNEAEGCWVMRAANNAINIRIDGATWARFNPAFKINNYIGSAKPSYAFLYRPGFDTIRLTEGYQYSLYQDRTNNRLLIQLDTIIRDSTFFYLAQDPTLAVSMDGFWAAGGEGCDTLSWRTESEKDNAGFMIYRRIDPKFLDSLSRDSTLAITNDTLLNNAGIVFKKRLISATDTLWVPVFKSLFAGAKGGTSVGPRKYKALDFNVHNDVQYLYKLVAIDFANEPTEYEKYAAARPAIRIPTEYRLGINYPNPFKHFTTIRFDLPKKSPVVLNIYTMKGALIKRLSNGNGGILKPGKYKVMWDGTDMSGRAVGTGPYVYQIVAGEYRKAKSMILIR